MIPFRSEGIGCRSGGLTSIKASDSSRESLGTIGLSRERLLP